MSCDQFAEIKQMYENLHRGQQENTRLEEDAIQVKVSGERLRARTFWGYCNFRGLADWGLGRRLLAL